MTELLAPAGDLKSFQEAIKHGCNAVYIGLDTFSARAYAKNFSLNEIASLVTYAHSYNVKVYVAMNTIIYDDELPKAYLAVDALVEANVDGIICCCLGLISYITNSYPSFEVHLSTQMGIDSLDGCLFWEKYGVSRVVLGRETPLKDVLYIAKNTKLEIEVFIHGALCVSYSGHCLMSGLIGLRSGNRGRCVGSCRKNYRLLKDGKEIVSGYLLSMKDLNTSQIISDLTNVASLKIEGRMKDSPYIANVVRQYRNLLDNAITAKEANKNLVKSFNRTFTKGYIGAEATEAVTNPSRPNNYGYLIGYIDRRVGNKYKITLSEALNQHDYIRITEGKTEINMPVNKLYNPAGELVAKANYECLIELQERFSAGVPVYKTKDVVYEANIDNLPHHRNPIDIELSLTSDDKICCLASCFGYKDITISSFSLQAANNAPLQEEHYRNAFNKLNDTPFVLNNFKLLIPEVYFARIKDLNEFRRIVINNLTAKMLERKQHAKKQFVLTPPAFELAEKQIVVYAHTLSQYNAAKDLGVKHIYYKNVAKRHTINYPKENPEVLVGSYGALYHYKDTKIVSDYAFNIVNAKACGILHLANVDRVTLSYELNQRQINTLIDEYQKLSGGLPRLEMIVYGYTPLLNTKHCILKANGLCGECKKGAFSLNDDIGEFPLIFNEDCSISVLNGKRLNLIDDFMNINNISYFRLQFSIESYEEAKQVIQNYLDRLKGLETDKFNSETDTRGFFNREIL